ncbi:hypothetical protein BDP55DRAFT_747403 [Colletotrichum godetiae]|uniref:Uncharacterized protein n=1 Tax=Colletotrichum godetiae TaxID=1209918 RepID=A0AAJ0ESD2_9PEZI|nr:uncharacterized protein BDP55DRAFT_747403 [Colletotrichum godetiae]KAK1673747.1 hypothetical protein BDP55DRAFT_747403 [Colletotrichum godetiae]
MDRVGGDGMAGTDYAGDLRYRSTRAVIQVDRGAEGGGKGRELAAGLLEWQEPSRALLAVLLHKLEGVQGGVRYSFAVTKVVSVNPFLPLHHQPMAPTDDNSRGPAGESRPSWHKCALFVLDQWTSFCAHAGGMAQRVWYDDCGASPGRHLITPTTPEDRRQVPFLCQLAPTGTSYAYKTTHMDGGLSSERHLFSAVYEVQLSPTLTRAGTKSLDWSSQTLDSHRKNANIDDGACGMAWFGSLMSVDHVLPLSAITAGRPWWDGWKKSRNDIAVLVMVYRRGPSAMACSLWWLLVGTVSSQVGGQGNESLLRSHSKIGIRTWYTMPDHWPTPRCWQANSSDGGLLPALHCLELVADCWLLAVGGTGGQVEVRTRWKILSSRCPQEMEQRGLAFSGHGLKMGRNGCRRVAFPAKKQVSSQGPPIGRPVNFGPVHPLPGLVAPSRPCQEDRRTGANLTSERRSLAESRCLVTGGRVGYSLPGLNFQGTFPSVALHLAAVGTHTYAKKGAQTCTDACTHRPSHCPTSTQTHHTLTGQESELRTTNGADSSSPSNSLHKHGSVELAEDMDSPDRVLPLIVALERPEVADGPQVHGNIGHTDDLTNEHFSTSLLGRDCTNRIKSCQPRRSCGAERGYLTLSSDSFDVSSELNANDTAFGPPAMPVPLDWHLNGGSATRALCSARSLPTSGGCWSLDRTTGRCGTKRTLDHRPQTRLLEGYRWSDLISSLSRRRHPCSFSTFPMRWCGWLRTRAQWEPTPVSLACLEYPVDGRGLEPLIITAPTHATDEIWSSSETTMHNGPGSGDLNTINTQYRFRAQSESISDASVPVQIARWRSGTGLAETCQCCYCPSTGKPAAVNISATRQVGMVSADQPVTQSSDQNASGGNSGPANGLALPDQPSRITLQRPLMLHASCTRDSLLEATGTLRRQPWDNLIGTKEPHHLFGTEYWLSKGFDDRDTNPLSESVELKPRARNQWPRPMSGSRPRPVSSQMQDNVGGPQLPSLLSSDPEAMP